MVALWLGGIGHDGKVERLEVCGESKETKQVTI